MSVSKYKYDPWKCDGDICVGDCDQCSKIEQDGDITWDGFTDDYKGLSESVHTNDGRS